MDLSENKSLDIKEMAPLDKDPPWYLSNNEASIAGSSIFLELSTFPGWLVLQMHPRSVGRVRHRISKLIHRYSCIPWLCSNHETNF